MCLSACPSVSSSPPWIMVKTQKEQTSSSKVKHHPKPYIKPFHADLFRFRSTKLIKTAQKPTVAHTQHHPLPRNNASLREIIVTIVPWESPNKALFSKGWGGIREIALRFQWKTMTGPLISLCDFVFTWNGERKPLIPGWQTADIVWNNQQQFDIRYTRTNS